MSHYSHPVSTKRFVVTYVPISPTTRRRTGKAHTEVVSFDQLARYMTVTHQGTEKHPDPPEPTPQNVEQAFEKMGRGQVKVIDVRDECNHQWEEQPGEPPRDVCFHCGEERR